MLDDFLFRKLSPQEEEQFRQHARENDPPNLAHWNVYHPVCREEWTKRGIVPPWTKGGCVPTPQHAVCAISWVDDKGNPTPDTNESVGYCYLEAHTSEVTGAWYGKFYHERSDNFPICEAHRQQITGHAMRHWVFVPWATEGKA